MRICYVNRVIPKKSKNIVSGPNHEFVTVYSILLNNEIWVNNIFPEQGRWNRALKTSKKVEPKLALFSKEHGGLEPLKGNYICCHLGKDKKGWDIISAFYSLDVQHDVANELAKFNEHECRMREIPSSVPLYDFLVLKGYLKNEDGSISSKVKPRIRAFKWNRTDFLYDKEDNAIQPFLPTQRTDILTVFNGYELFRKFYHGRTPSETINVANYGNSWQHIYEHSERLGIYIKSERWNQSMKMHKADKLMEEKWTHLIILGDQLSSEHQSYLASIE
jgi:hypothetical protein